MLLLVLGLLGVPGDARSDDSLDSVVSLLELIIDADEGSARQCLAVISQQTQSGELSQREIAAIRTKLDKLLNPLVTDADHPLSFDAALVAASWRSAPAVRLVSAVFRNPKEPDERRLGAFRSLVALGDASILADAGSLLTASSTRYKLRSGILAELGKSQANEVAGIVLKAYPKLPADVQPKAIELLTQRPTWSLALMGAIADETIERHALNANQIRRLQASGDAELQRAITQTWGTVRTERNPQREKIVNDMKAMLSKVRGDAHHGQVIFQKVCGQCHTIHGTGQKVGPDITGNGRASFDQLLSNVFDPSLVIGASYQARTVVTDEGRILSGLLVEDNDQRIVLRMQGGKQEIIPRDAIDAISVSKLSLMPEGLEKQLKPEELADLFSFITLDKPPADASAKRIPGSPSFQ